MTHTTTGSTVQEIESMAAGDGLSVELGPQGLEDEVATGGEIIRQPGAITSQAVIEAVISDAAEHDVFCDEATAGLLIEHFVEALGAANEADVVLGESRVRRGNGMQGLHAVLDVVVPDGAVSTPDSAHALLEELLGTGNQVVAVAHTVSDLYVEDDNCVVTVSTATVNLS